MGKRGTGKKVDYVKINRNKKTEADQAAQPLPQHACEKKDLQDDCGNRLTPGN